MDVYASFQTLFGSNFIAKGFCVQPGFAPDDRAQRDLHEPRFALNHCFRAIFDVRMADLIVLRVSIILRLFRFEWRGA